MAHQTVQVSTPVRVESDSKQRVAYDLMHKIDAYSGLDNTQKHKTYWLTLYRQCFKAVVGHDLESILKED